MLCANLAFAQDLPSSEVPSIVINSFNRSFPQSSKVEWELKGEIYNAEFDVDWRDHEVWISKTGAILKHKKEVKKAELPTAISNVITRDYSTYRIDDIDQFEINKRFYYKVELKKHDEEKKIIFDQKGKVSGITL